MSFRLKTILGIALIQGCLLLFLVWSSLDYLSRSNEKALALRAQVVSESLANLTRDAVLSTDLVRLTSVVHRTLESPGVSYIRILDTQDVLVKAGSTDALRRPFVADQALESTTDGVFDIGVDIEQDGTVHGRVELGLSVAEVSALIADARGHLIGIAAIAVVMVALFSYVLGTYLTRGLKRLAQASREISAGTFGTRVIIDGRDELADAAVAFNSMSSRLVDLQREMTRSVRDSEALARRLSEKELRLSAILDTAVSGFITVDERGVIEDINPAGAALFGYRREELIGHDVAGLISCGRAAEKGVFFPQHPRPGEVPMMSCGRHVDGLRKDGGTFPVELSVSEMQIENQRLFVGLVRDLSEQRRAEAAARRSELLKTAVVAANLDALVTIDTENRIVEFSPVAERIFGYSRREAVGQLMPELIIPPHLRARHAEGMRTYFESKQCPVLGNRVEVEALHRSGEVFPVEITVQAIDVEGEVFFTAFIRDIRERREAEQALIDAKRNAEVASEAKSRFLAHMSHEIRSPLNAVLGSLDLLLDHDLNQHQRLYAQTAHASGKTLLSLINDILDFSKIEAAQMGLEANDFDLHNVLAEIMDLVAYKARDKALPVVGAIDHKVFPYLNGDPMRLRQILGNLLDNAIKFTDHGAVSLQVEQTRETADRVSLRFTVADTGIGVPAQLKASLFNEFQQVDSSDSTRFGGTGLGLSICHGLVKLMGGGIKIDSEPGTGSRFMIDLEFAKSRSRKFAVSVVPDVASCRLLTVALPAALGDLLRRHGPRLSVREADSPVAAVPLLSEGVDVLLVNGLLTPVDVDALGQLARSMGVPRMLLLAATEDTGNMDRTASGLYDDLLLMPLMIEQVVGALSTRPAQSNRTVGEALGEDARELPGAGKHILLAEDSAANQLVATGMLEHAGYDVEVVNDGKEAVAAFEIGRYDLILMDLRMPNLDGLGATMAIRKQPGGDEIPIVAMTANVFKEDRERCIAAGMDDFVTKPVSRQYLLDTIARHLRSDTPDVDEPASRSANPVSVPVGEQPLLNMRIIEQMGADVGQDAVHGMVEMFLAEANERVEQLRHDLDEATTDILQDQAHTLKSCAGTFGAVRLQLLAQDIELACRQGNRHAAEALGEQTATVMRETLAAFRAHYASPTDTNN